MDIGNLIPGCLTPFGAAVIWLAHWGLFAIYVYRTRGRIQLKDVFGGDAAMFLAAMFLPLFTAPLWIPGSWLLGAMFGMKCIGS
jgi:hypothetical protein